MESGMIAPCGLDCSTCDIYRAKDDPEIMKRVIEWFREKRNKVFVPDQIRCGGCPGNRSNHWDPACWILKCAVDERGYRHCSECSDFPCDRLEKWAKGSSGYSKALSRLRQMRRNGES